MTGSVVAASESQCLADGWRAVSVAAVGQTRTLLWKGPAGLWSHGAIIVLHGGGGSHHHWCAESSPLVEPQVEFSRQALARGFAVFALDSTADVVTDANGRPCGKRFDATVLARPNVDLPFIERVITDVIPGARPSGSSPSVFLTGESTGGLMAIRAATHFDGLVTAFAPVAAADPYGTEFNCDPTLSPRQSAKGVGVDRDTNRRINDRGACEAQAASREAVWETMGARARPRFKQFHHQGDAVVDLSCAEKAGERLRQHGYPDDGAVILRRAWRRRLVSHLWQSEYNGPLLEFFSRCAAGMPEGG